jgi:hypothetical protein
MIAALLFTLALSQQPQQPPPTTQTFGAQRPAPPRDASQAEKKGTGVISGRITS